MQSGDHKGRGCPGPGMVPAGNVKCVARAKRLKLRLGYFFSLSVHNMMGFVSAPVSSAGLKFWVRGFPRGRRG